MYAEGELLWNGQMNLFIKTKSRGHSEKPIFLFLKLICLVALELGLVTYRQ